MLDYGLGAPLSWTMSEEVRKVGPRADKFVEALEFL